MSNEEKHIVNHVFKTIDVLNTGSITPEQLRDCQYFFSHPLKYLEVSLNSDHE